MENNPWEEKSVQELFDLIKTAVEQKDYDLLDGLYDDMPEEDDKRALYLWAQLIGGLQDGIEELDTYGLYNEYENILDSGLDDNKRDYIREYYTTHIPQEYLLPGINNNNTNNNNNNNNNNNQAGGKHKSKLKKYKKTRKQSKKSYRKTKKAKKSRKLRH